jgi:hypothetical protein
MCVCSSGLLQSLFRRSKALNVGCKAVCAPRLLCSNCLSCARALETRALTVPSDTPSACAASRTLSGILFALL